MFTLRALRAGGAGIALVAFVTFSALRTLRADGTGDAAGLPFSSYEELGDRHRITKQGVYSIMKRYAKSYGWIEGIMQIRAIRNTRGVPDPESRRRIASWREKRQTELHRGK